MQSDIWGYYSDFDHALAAGMIDLDFFQDKCVLVTGATGLIGSAFLDFLIFLKIKKSVSLNIYALSRSSKVLYDKFKVSPMAAPFTVIEQDIRKPLAGEFKFDCVVHFASAASPNIYLEDPVGTIKTTILGMENVLEYAKLHGAKVLYASSVEVYGEIKSSNDKVGEDDFGFLNCNSVRSSYPEAKRLAESMCQAYYSQFHTDVAIVRPCKIYGPSNNGSDQRVMAHILDTVTRSADIVLQSDGSRVFSFCYVTDVVSAFAVLLAKGRAGDAYNISDDQSICSLKEIALTAARLAGVQASFSVGDPNAGVSKDTVVSSDKLQKLGWSPLTNITQGLEKQYRVSIRGL